MRFNLKKDLLTLYIYLTLLISLSGALVAKGLVNAALFTLLLPSLFYIKKTWIFLHQTKQIKAIALTVLILTLPIIAIAVGQTGRQDWFINHFDGPSRILLATPLLFLFIFKRINFTRILYFAAPLLLLLTIISIYIYPEYYWGNRIATSFVDPNALGAYAALFTATCLFQIDVSSKLYLPAQLYPITGTALGIYLVLASGTRGSWPAIFLVLILWIYFNRKKLRPASYLYLLLLFSLPILALSYTHPELHDRFLSGIQEVKDWLNHTNLHSSPGFRLSIYKISWQLFLHQPLFGYGEMGFIPFLEKPWFDSTATNTAKSLLTNAGAHNEFLANLLRSGILGGLSTLGLFVIPFYIFIKNSPSTNKAAQIGLAVILSLSVSSLTIEIFNLKYECSLFALIITGLIAQIIHSKKNINQTENNSENQCNHQNTQ